MSPEEILADLRDIHLPPPPTGVRIEGWAPEPFMVFAVVLAAAVAYAMWRRGDERRSVRRRVAAFLARQGRGQAVVDPVQHWPTLVGLFAAARKAGMDRSPPPSELFRDLARLDADTRRTLLTRLRRLIR